MFQFLIITSVILCVPVDSAPALYIDLFRFQIRKTKIQMTKIFKYISIGSILTSLPFAACNNRENQKNQAAMEVISGPNTDTMHNSVVYESKKLIIRKVSNHVYEHVSFLDSKDFGRVSCNGMIVVNDNEAVVFDTPTENESSEELISYVMKKLQCRINAVIPTHFHSDCVGGLDKFNEYNIPAYASDKTVELLRIKNQLFSKPIAGFSDSAVFNIGDKKVYARYFGEGHTKDNIVGYFPEDKVLFGGCLIKEIGSEKGNLEDANTKKWPGTVLKLKQKYPQVKVVIPGHGQKGGTKLFDYTIKLFR